MQKIWREIIMVEQDTVRLLRECDAGVKMGVSSIDEVLGKIRSDKFREILEVCRDKHVRLNSEIQEKLEQFGDDGKDPNPMAKGMSWMKTNIKLAVDPSDERIADVMTDGCNMGVKSLHKYLNQYKAADEGSKRVTKKLIDLEEKLAIDMRNYL